ncbi:trans-L-3-hydroxyproline dehydratase-like [Mizuhopecten yessoensis]|uniref:trans-L-3-hydroxyproline dehydratase n=1 Tax=Mizuhopecten yessoensis TaxID=6573 RepID=A0A210Q9M4_MIZYE|nr:trans-L-3-hydroxyproline dehydratase-like [Mizuhopecten yessoensis]OWF45442.1 Trans-L-3-hydroxyproline dehydratase [Mizuhopecten yessoensis]
MRNCILSHVGMLCKSSLFCFQPGSFSYSLHFVLPTQHVHFAPLHSDVRVVVPGYGHVTVDIAYGGSFFAFVPDSQYNFRLGEVAPDVIRSAAAATTDALEKQLTLSHPDSDDLAFLFATVIKDGQDERTDIPSSHTCVFAEKQLDRSPCGSGTTARVALLYHKGHVKLNQTRTFRSYVKSEFQAKAVQEVTYGGW